MPNTTPDRLKSKVNRLRKKLAEKKASLEGAQIREIKKQIRRAQRKRRRIVAAESRARGAAAKPAE